MHLLLHQFRKDFRQTWVVWALWFFFVLAQFGLAAWTVNPADLAGAGLYSQIVGMVPIIHAILVFILIPLLVYQEPPVGTTASWLTRPMPAATVLGSKLISFGILVLLPLLGQCLVLAAHHVVMRDVILAGLEIALKELSWIALATGLAVVCPNFAAFLVAAAGLYVLQYCSGWLWSWVSLIGARAATRFDAVQQPSAFLAQSRSVVVDLLWIAFGLGVVFLQYLTRRTRVALGLGICSLVTTAIIARYWPWDFVASLARTTPVSQSTFDASALHFSPGGCGTFQNNDPQAGTSHTTVSLVFNVSGLPPEENLTLGSGGGEVAFPDGSKLSLQPNPNPNGFSQIEFDGFRGQGSGGNPVAPVESAVGDLLILNQQFGQNSSYSVQDLFTLDTPTFSKKGADLGTAVFRLKGHASGYRIVAEIPLKQGEFFSDQSHRSTLTDILRQKDGVSLVLRERSLNLLLAPPNPNTNAQPLYLLLNRKRSEALWGQNSGGGENFFAGPGPGDLLSTFDLGDNRFEVFNLTTLAFNASPGDDHPLPVPIDGEWLAGAVLVRLEPDSHGDFTAPVRIADFALDGHTLANGDQDRSDEPNLEALRRVVLPPHPTRPEVWRYITHILYASSRQRNSNNDDPQVGMLAQVGPEHATDLLIAATTFGGGFNYPHEALKTLDLTGQEDAKRMLFRLLPYHTDLIDLITLNHWEADAKPILMARLANRRSNENIDDIWLDVLTASAGDPAVKAAILDLLRSQQGVIRIVIAQHWEADAKPILISVIARTKPGSPIDDRWVQVLDSFHDDSRVKAMLLRVLPSNPGAIETVVQNHWEMDAKPVLLQTLNNAKRGDSIDDRWFRVLAALPDRSGVQEAVLRVLPFCHNAIEAVIQDHWEQQALPVMLDVLAKLKPSGEGGSVDERWFPALNTVADQPGVKEAILRVLPFCHDAITLVLQNHWESEARPIFLDVLNHARAGGWEPDSGWYTAVDAVADQPGVKAAVLHALPFFHSAIMVVIKNHWEADARPILLATLNKAKAPAGFDDSWFDALDAVPDKTGDKEAVLHVLPLIQNAVGAVYRNHWEKDAQPIVLDVLAKAKPDDRFPNEYISLATTDPSLPGVKEAVLRALPNNPNAINFIMQYGWEKAAEPILVERLSSLLAGQQMDRRWTQVLAGLGDPAIYPLLLTYAENNFRSHSFTTIDDIRPLPASLVRPLVARAWKEAQDSDQEFLVWGPAAKWGFTDILDRVAGILMEPPDADKKKSSRQQFNKILARQALEGATASPMRLLDADLAAWYQTRKNQLAFDPGLNEFVLHAKPLSLDESWPTAANMMTALGRRALTGDDTAFAEMVSALDRATESLDPVVDAQKVRSMRGKLGNPAFAPFQDQVSTNPGVLSLLDAANQQPELRRFVVGVYGRAATAGNTTALDAMLHYQDHQWDLADVVEGLQGAVARGDAKAIAFLGALPADPKSTTTIYNRASGELLTPANAGNEAAKAAYRGLEKFRGNLAD